MRDGKAWRAILKLCGGGGTTNPLIRRIRCLLPSTIIRRHPYFEAAHLTVFHNFTISAQRYHIDIASVLQQRNKFIASKRYLRIHISITAISKRYNNNITHYHNITTTISQYYAVVSQQYHNIITTLSQNSIRKKSTEPN